MEISRKAFPQQRHKLSRNLTTSYEIKTVIKQIKSKSSHGYDELSNKIIQNWED